MNPSTKTSSLVATGLLLAGLSLSCSGPSNPSQELLELRTGALTFTPVELPSITAAYEASVDGMRPLKEQCLTLLEGDLEEVKQKRKQLLSACLTPLEKNLRGMQSFTGRHFRVDEYLSASSSLHDAIRILIWRLKFETSADVCKEGIRKCKQSWANLEKIADAYSPEDGLDPLVEEQVLGAPFELLDRFLNSDQGTIGLLFEQATRNLYVQGKNPNNIRDKSLQHKLDVTRTRLRIRMSVILQKVRSGETDPELEPYIADYTERALRLTDTIETHIQAALQEGKRTEAELIEWRGETGERFLEWATAFEGLLTYAKK